MMKRTVKVLAFCTLLGSVGVLDANAQSNKEKKEQFTRTLSEKDVKVIEKEFKKIGKELEKLAGESEGTLEGMVETFGKLIGGWGKGVSIGNINSDQFKDSKRVEFSVDPSKCRLKNKEIPYHVLKDEQVVISAFPYRNEQSYIKEVKNVDDETHITFAQFIHFPSNWTQFTSGSYLIDTKSNERIYPIGLTNGMPLDSVLVVKNHANSLGLFTLRFPKLDDKTIEIIFKEVSNPAFPAPSNGERLQSFYMNIEEYDLDKNDEAIVARLNNNKRYVLHNHEGYRLSPREFDEVYSVRVKKHKFYQAIANGEMFIYDEMGRRVFNEPYFHIKPVYKDGMIKFEVKKGDNDTPKVINRGGVS